MLAQVSISATNSNSNYIYNVKGVRLCELCGKASLVTNIKWELSEEKATYEDVYEIPVTLQSNAQSIIHPDSGNAFVIPQVLTPWNPEEDPRNINKGAYISVKLQITNNAGEQVFPSTPGEYEWIAIPFNQVLNEGGNHNIVLDFTNGAGYTAPTSTNPGIKVLGGIIQIQ